LIQNEETKKFILADIKAMGKQAQFVGYEIPFKIHLTTIAFTEENSLLTTTLKFKRFEAKNFFMSVIKDLYDGAKLMGE
jgi:long-chain acyl-CoA synthetase